MSFRYACYRDFKSYAGRVSALYELIEIAVREFELSASNSVDEEKFIENMAAKHGLNVHFPKCPHLLGEILSLHIVNVHEAFARYLKKIRIEASELVGLTWKDYDKKDDLQIAITNVFGAFNKGKEALGEMQVDLCDYYRLVRNGAVHADGAKNDLEKSFSKVEKYQIKSSELYVTIKLAPNPPHQLTRDDFQLFVRVAQDIAWGFSQKLKPTDVQLKDSLATVLPGFKAKWPDNEPRIASAILSFLEKTYGLSRVEASKIASLIH